MVVVVDSFETFSCAWSYSCPLGQTFVRDSAGALDASRKQALSMSKAFPKWRSSKLQAVWLFRRSVRLPEDRCQNFAGLLSAQELVLHGPAHCTMPPAAPARSCCFLRPMLYYLPPLKDTVFTSPLVAPNHTIVSTSPCRTSASRKRTAFPAWLR